MRFAIFGVGAVGGYFGGRLAQAGEDVTFIALGDHLKALRTKGLRLDSVNGLLAAQWHDLDAAGHCRRAPI